jgi:hypothetical protein
MKSVAVKNRDEARCCPAMGAVRQRQDRVANVSSSRGFCDRILRVDRQTARLDCL